MKNKMLKILSYVVVALLSCALTLTVIFFLPLDNYTKLEQLEGSQSIISVIFSMLAAPSMHTVR